MNEPEGTLCTNPAHGYGDHGVACVPAADPGNPRLRLLRAIYGLCADCDRADAHEHENYGDVMKDLDAMKLSQELTYTGAEALLLSLGVRPGIAVDALNDACILDEPQEVAGHNDILYTVSRTSGGYFDVTEAGAGRDD